MSNNNNKEPPSTGAKDADEVVDVIVKEIPDSKVHWEYSQDSSSAKVYDKKPIKLLCREGRMYMWYVIVLDLLVKKLICFLSGVHAATQRANPFVMDIIVLFN